MAILKIPKPGSAAGPVHRPRQGKNRRLLIVSLILGLLVVGGGAVGCMATRESPGPATAPPAAGGAGAGEAAQAKAEQVPAPGQDLSVPAPDHRGCQMLTPAQTAALLGGPVKSYPTTEVTNVRAGLFYNCTAVGSDPGKQAFLLLGCGAQFVPEYLRQLNTPTSAALMSSAPGARTDANVITRAYALSQDKLCVIDIGLTGAGDPTVVSRLATALKQAYESPVTQNVG